MKTITKETTADKTVFSFDFTTLSQAKQSENKRQEKKRRVKGLKSEGRWKWRETKKRRKDVGGEHPPVVVDEIALPRVGEEQSRH